GIPPRIVWSRWRGGIVGGVSTVSIVWPCPLPAGVYAAAGREVEFPRPDCPSCAVPMVFWSGYRRYVRDSGICVRIFVPRVRCGPCEVSHALLPAFVLARRLDVAEVIGKVVGEVAGGGCGVRPAAGRGGASGALPVERGADAVPPPADAGRFAVAAIGAAFGAAAGLPGWAGLGRWRFACAVSGGTLIAANMIAPWLIVGKRRFMPPVPLTRQEGGRWHGQQGAGRGGAAPLGGDRRGGRCPADGRGAGRGGAADRRAGSPAPGGVPAPLLAGDDRPVDRGLARRRPGGPAARGTLGYRDGPRAPGAVRRGRRAAAGTARPLRRADRLDPV